MEIEQRKRQQRRPQKQPLWKEILWMIPKNLVYIFALVIILSFVVMIWITYTEKNMTEFLTYERNSESVRVDPLFTSLKESMRIKPSTVVPSK
jgi:hypothetical protein